MGVQCIKLNICSLFVAYVSIMLIIIFEIKRFIHFRDYTCTC